MEGEAAARQVDVGVRVQYAVDLGADLATDEGAAEEFDFAVDKRQVLPDLRIAFADLRQYRAGLRSQRLQLQVDIVVLRLRLRERSYEVESLVFRLELLEPIEVEQVLLGPPMRSGALTALRDALE